MAISSTDEFMQPARKLAFACWAMTAPLLAQAGDWTPSANVGLTTDYVFRGISQTDENPALQASVELSHASGFYLGIWGSNVDFNDGDEAEVEIDYYAGFASELTDELSWDAGVLYYSYPGASSDLDYDYWEGKLGLAYSLGDVAMTPTFGVEAYYTPEYFGNTGDATYLIGTLGLALTEELELSAGVGYQSFSESGLVDYTDWKLGLATEMAGIEMELAYTDTDLEKSDCGDTDICEGRILFTVSKSFE